MSMTRNGFKDINFKGNFVKIYYGNATGDRL